MQVDFDDYATLDLKICLTWYPSFMLFVVGTLVAVEISPIYLKIINFIDNGKLGTIGENWKVVRIPNNFVF